MLTNYKNFHKFQVNYTRDQNFLQSRKKGKINKSKYVQRSDTQRIEHSRKPEWSCFPHTGCQSSRYCAMSLCNNEKAAASASFHPSWCLDFCMLCHIRNC